MKYTDYGYMNADVFGSPVPFLGEYREYDLGVADVHLATIGLDVEFLVHICLQRYAFFSELVFFHIFAYCQHE